MPRQLYGRIEDLIKVKMKGEVAKAEESRPKEALTKSMNGGTESYDGILEVT